ncbi:MAG: hypothetical protein WDO74_24350 [Pseudomonadota bacterium]
MYSTPSPSDLRRSKRSRPAACKASSSSKVSGALQAGRIQTLGLGEVGQQACQIVLRGLGGHAVLRAERLVYQVMEERLQVTREVDVGLIRAHGKAPSKDVHALRATTFERHLGTTRAASQLRLRRHPPKTGTCLQGTGRTVSGRLASLHV